MTRWWHVPFPLLATNKYKIFDFFFCVNFFNENILLSNILTQVNKINYISNIRRTIYRISVAFSQSLQMLGEKGVKTLQIQKL